MILQINTIDEILRKFSAIKVLILNLNWIKELPGKYIPRHVRFLELFANEVEDVTSLCQKAPTKTLHLGLCRNKLTDSKYLIKFLLMQ